MDIVARLDKLRSSTIIYHLVHILMISLGVSISLLGGAIWTSIGTSLIATGSAGVLIYLYYAHNQRNVELVEGLREFGLQQIYDERSGRIRHEEYASRLQRARYHVDIIGFGLTSFRVDYISDLGALATRAKVRILLLDPDSPFAAQRDREEGLSEGVIAGEIREFVSQYERQRSLSPNGATPPRIEVRLYTCLPLLNVFRIDDEIFYGPYLAGRASRKTVTMRARRGVIYDQMVHHFDEVWERHSRPLPHVPVAIAAGPSPT
ncbi:DUF5919 domain-containing protein [Phytohabitans houttuyneae]|uniref:DUF5919 domain-containing protein n=1 Tax=Phytohabitans houttuyneae TaxID=1076126 RepID=A0A6V8KNB8_9ACTN|nr:DUF5919 domain-containing protein [Phytohabitans houttuyneae]GFJ84078.1 hypothetical protein Phou_082580 [Phytohabitans houttuyneae]